MDLKQLAEPKFRPFLISGFAIAMTVTAVCTACLCCGLGQFLIPSDARRTVEISDRRERSDEPAPDTSGEEKLNPEELAVLEAALRADARRRDLAAVKKSMNADGKLPVFYPEQLAGTGTTYAAFSIGQVGRMWAPLTILQVIDRENVIVVHNGREATTVIWMTGLPRNEFVDGAKVTLEGAYIIDGRKQYATANGGSKTVFLFRPVEASVLDDAGVKPMGDD